MTQTTSTDILNKDTDDEEALLYDSTQNDVSESQEEEQDVVENNDKNKTENQQFLTSESILERTNTQNKEKRSNSDDVMSRVGNISTEFNTVNIITDKRKRKPYRQAYVVILNKTV